MSPEGLQKGQKGLVVEKIFKNVKKGSGFQKTNFVYTKGLIMSKP